MVSRSVAPQAIEVLHDNRLMRRLLGAAVLIALAVIFLPLIFDGAGTESQFRSIEPLESEPPYDLEVMQENALPELSDSTVVEFVEDRAVNELPDKGIDASPVIEVQKDDIEIADAPAQNPKPVEIAKPAPAPATSVAEEQSWLVQTASFKDKINALSLRSDLKKTGYPVQVKVAELEGQSIFRVYVGPIDGVREAGRIKAALDRKLHRNTLLVAQ